MLEQKRAGLGILLFRCFQHLIIDVARFNQATHQRMALRLIGIEPVLKCPHALNDTTESERSPCANKVVSLSPRGQARDSTQPLDREGTGNKRKTHKLDAMV